MDGQGKEGGGGVVRIWNDAAQVSEAVDIC